MHERAYAVYNARWSNGMKAQGALKRQLRLHNEFAGQCPVERWKNLVTLRAMGRRNYEDQLAVKPVKSMHKERASASSS